MTTNRELSKRVAKRMEELDVPVSAEFLLNLAPIEDLDLDKELQHSVDKQAYCKYCYQTHVDWYLSIEHFPACWVCQHCNHFTLDTCMGDN